MKTGVLITILILTSIIAGISYCIGFQEGGKSIKSTKIETDTIRIIKNRPLACFTGFVVLSKKQSGAITLGNNFTYVHLIITDYEYNSISVGDTIK